MTEAVINYVALLGWCPEGNQEIFSLEELVKEFDYHNMSKSPAVFDIQKLKWMNGEYLKAMDFDKFFERAEKYIKEVVTKDYDLKKIAALVKTRIEIFPDIKEQIDFFEELPEYDTAMYCHKKMKTNEEKALEVLKEIYPLLEKQDDFSNDALFEVLKSYVDEKRVSKQVMLCGQSVLLCLVSRVHRVEQRRSWRFSEKKSLLREFRKVLNYWKDKGSL